MESPMLKFFFWLILVPCLLTARLKYENILEQMIAIANQKMEDGAIFNPAEQPQIIELSNTATEPSIQTQSLDAEAITYNPTLLNNITNMLLPLTINTKIDKILDQDTSQVSYDEQLENSHMIAAFITKLKTKVEMLSVETQAYLKSQEFAQHIFAKKLFGIMLSLQNFLNNQLESYKNMKPQPQMVRELKKVILQQKKIIDPLIETWGIR